jgi:hypothetical protein
MDSDRFDDVVRSLARTGSRRRVLSGLLAAAVAGLRPGRMLAQEENAAGNGGTADASTNGGAVATGNVNSGGNAGSAIGVDDTAGGVAVDGGSAANSSSFDISAEGGTAIADASGGDENVAFLRETCPNAVACDPSNACGPASSDCKCWPTTEGGSLCGQGELCAAAPVCETSADCPMGELCTLTCCTTPGGSPLLTCSLPCGVTRPGVVAAQGTGASGGWKSVRP